MNHSVNRTQLLFRFILIFSVIISLSFSTLPAQSKQADSSQSDSRRDANQSVQSQRQQSITTDQRPSGDALASLPLRFPGRDQVGPNDLVEVMIELDEPSSVQVYAQAEAQAKLAPLAAAPEPRRAAQSQMARIEQAQRGLMDALEGPGMRARVMNRLRHVYNGIAVQVEAGKLDEIRTLPGVKAIHPVMPVELASNAAVPFIGTPTAWTAGLGARSEGIKIGLIDTGIDYLHTNFGGPGSGYADNNRTIVGDAPNFPGMKIAGGYDFVGDDFNPGSSDPAKRIPVPDPDPMDCHSHGTGVASALAGYGVNADGSTYTGPYDLTTPFTSMRISPGVAPGRRALCFESRRLQWRNNYRARRSGD
jgi:subtilisin family serine protease